MLRQTALKIGSVGHKYKKNPERIIIWYLSTSLDKSTVWLIKSLEVFFSFSVPDNNDNASNE